MRSRLLSGAAFAIGTAAIVVWGCGGGGYSSPAPGPSPAPGGGSGNSAAVTVNIVGDTGAKAYQPNPVSANSGDTIAFKNNGGTTHHIVMDDGSADFGALAPGQTSQAITLHASTGRFHCTIHSSMVGSINAPVPDPPPCDNPGYCD